MILVKTIIGNIFKGNLLFPPKSFRPTWPRTLTHPDGHYWLLPQQHRLSVFPEVLMHLLHPHVFLGTGHFIINDTSSCWWLSLAWGGVGLPVWWARLEPANNSTITLKASSFFSCSFCLISSFCFSPLSEYLLHDNRKHVAERWTFTSQSWRLFRTAAQSELWRSDQVWLIAWDTWGASLPPQDASWVVVSPSAATW